MKKLTALLLTASVIISLASCGGSESASTTTSDSTTTTSAATEGTTPPETTTTEETTTTLESTTTTDVTTTTTTVSETTPPSETSTTTTTTAVATSKTETTTTTEAPKYDHCEGFDKLWGMKYGELKNIEKFGEAGFGAGAGWLLIDYYSNIQVFDIDFDSISFYCSESEDENPCRMVVLEHSDDAVTAEDVKTILSELYGAPSKDGDKYLWNKTADGNIELSATKSGIKVKLSE